MNLIKPTDIVKDLQTNKRMICLVSWGNSFLLDRKELDKKECTFQIVYLKDINFINNINNVEDLEEYAFLRKSLFDREVIKYKTEHRKIETLISNLKDYNLM